jgi:hypothetical protein
VKSDTVLFLSQPVVQHHFPKSAEQSIIENKYSKHLRCLFLEKQ